MSSTLFIVLAAGKGTRMKSSLPKVMHKIAGTSMLDICINKILSITVASRDRIVIVCSEENIEEIKLKYKDFDNIFFTIQEQRLGTGHAVRLAVDYATIHLNNNFINIAVIYADSPLFNPQTVKELACGNGDVNFAGFKDNNPECKFGRFVFNEKHELIDIVEFKDASPEQKQNLNTFNSGFVGGRLNAFKTLLPLIKNNNNAGEFYLTDLVKLAWQNNFTTNFVICDKKETFGVNDKIDLSIAEEMMQNELRQNFMIKGVTLIDPKSVFFSLDTIIEHDVTIEPNVFIGAGVVIKSGSIIKSFSHLEGVCIEGASIGPFARVRGKSIIAKGAKIGNFVEVKNSNLEKGVKAGHLSYIGDANIGRDANIGAGVVFCNYDGVLKHKAIVGDGAFIGSNASLISPLKIGKNALIAAASVVDHDVADDAIYISRPQGKIAKQSASQYFANKSKKN